MTRGTTLICELLFHLYTLNAGASSISKCRHGASEVILESVRFDHFHRPWLLFKATNDSTSSSIALYENYSNNC